MLVTLFPIVMEVRAVQREKAPLPMLVTLLGMVTEVRPVQFWKAYSLMLVTLLGMVMEVRQPRPIPTSWPAARSAGS